MITALKHDDFQGFPLSGAQKHVGHTCMLKSKYEKLFHLQVSVHDAHGVQIVDRIQNLPDEPAGIHLRVKALLYNSVKQLPSRHAVGTQRATGDSFTSSEIHVHKVTRQKQKHLKPKTVKQLRKNETIIQIINLSCLTCKVNGTKCLSHGIV